MIGAPPSAEPVIEIGDCRINPAKQVLLASHRAGILKTVVPEEGDEVEAGQEIALIVDDTARATHAVASREAANDVDSRFARKAAEVAVLDHERFVEGNRRSPGTFPEVEVRKAKLDAEKAVMAIEQSDHQRAIHALKRDEVQAQLSTYRVQSPISGFVTRVYKSAGEAVHEGDPIVQVVNTQRVRVEGFLEAAQLSHIARGVRVHVRLEQAGGRSLEGRLAFVDVIVQPVTGKVRVWADVENPNLELRPGLPARMTLFPQDRLTAERSIGGKTTLEKATGEKPIGEKVTAKANRQRQPAEPAAP